MFFLTKYILPNINNENIGHTLILLLEINIDFTINCPIHDLKHLIYNKFKNLFLFTYIKNINRILSGIDKNNYSSDPLKKSAHNYNIKHKTRRR